MGAEDEMIGCIIDSMEMNLSKLGSSEEQGSLGCFSHGLQRFRNDYVTEQQCL